MTRVASLVKESVEAQREVSDLEAKLKTAKARLFALEFDKLPAALAACGYKPPTKLTIAGMPVELAEKYRCGQLEYPPSRPMRDDDTPRAKDPAAAFDWLDEHDHGDVARNQVIVGLPPGTTIEDARDLITHIKTHRSANQFDVIHKRVVPWNTLAALARELARQGDLVPFEKLGVRQERAARVLAKKHTQS